MRLSTRCIGLFGALAMAWPAVGEPTAPQPIVVRRSSAIEWVTLSPTPDDPKASAPVMTQAVVGIQRGADPDTGKPFSSKWPLSCAPQSIHRRFTLEKREFLLGEPILVQYQVSVEGPGELRESTGATSRDSGQELNFLFLLRREDGAWARRVYPQFDLVEPWPGRQGTAKEGQPITEWGAVQRQCVIDEPGRYELYCFYDADLYYDFTGSEQALRAQIPPEVLRMHDVGMNGELYKTGTKELSNTFAVEIRHVSQTTTPSPAVADAMNQVKDFSVPGLSTQANTDARRGLLGAIRFSDAFAHFPIVISEGTPEQKKSMVEAWTQRAETEKASGGSEDIQFKAVLGGIYYVSQSLFLPAIQNWVKTSPERVSGSGLSDGLGFNPDPAATAILLGLPDERFSYIRHRLTPWHSPGIDAKLVELLKYEDALVRKRALRLLQKDTGCYFFADAEGRPLEQLDDNQMKESQALWRVWWERNKTTFKPVSFYGIWGYIDASGKFVISPRYALAENFKRDAAVTAFEPPWRDVDVKRFYIDRGGAKLPKPYSDFGDAPLRPVREGETWGYANTEGKLVIPARYTWASAFSEGLAAVFVDGKTGFIDERGELAIPAKFDSSSPFEHGQAIAKVNGLSGIINRKGEFTLPPKYVQIGRPIDDRAWFQVRNRYGYLDASGKVVIEPRYLSAGDFKDGLALVRALVDVPGPDGKPMNRTCAGFIDRSGAVVVPIVYSDALPFSEGLAAVASESAHGHIWGYIDRTGAPVIPPQYDEAHSFSGGLAAVRELSKARPELRVYPGKWGFIDPSGKMVIPPQFMSTRDFSEGLAAVSVASPYFHLNPDDYRAAPATAQK